MNILLDIRHNADWRKNPTRTRELGVMKYWMPKTFRGAGRINLNLSHATVESKHVNRVAEAS